MSSNSETPDQKAGKGAYINLSVRLHLTDLGNDSFSEEKKRILASGDDENVILGNQLYAGALKKFIIENKINQIELQRAELISQKQEITDLTKLIVFSLLYRIFPHNLSKILLVKGFVLRELSEDDCQLLIMNKGEEIKTIKKNIFNKIKAFGLNQEINKEKDKILRKKEITSISTKLIEMIPMSFYKIAIRYPNKKEELLDSAIDLIYKYIKRTKISDYLSSAFLEWVSYAESINLTKSFEEYKIQYKKKNGTEYTNTNFENARHEDKDLMKSLRRTNKISLKINWKFGKNKVMEVSELEEVAIIKIRLVNKGLLKKEIKNSIENILNKKIKDENYSDMIEKDNEKQSGLIFTLFLKQECKKDKIDLYAKTKENKEKDETIMDLIMHLKSIK